MLTRITLCLALAGGLSFAQDEEELTPYSPVEAEQLMDTFKATYKNKKSPEADAIAALGNLKKAYRYLARHRGPEDAPISKEETKLLDDIVDLISKGLSARKRDDVNLECARVLGEIGAEDGAKPLKKWLEKVLDEKAPRPNLVEYGFQSLAWIGPDDTRVYDLLIKYGTRGVHQDMSVASHAIRACYLYRELDGKTRKEFFEKICGYVLGLYSNSRGGDPKTRATYEERYKTVKDNALTALNELAGDGAAFTSPEQANEWFDENDKRKWETYYGPRERARRAKLAAAAAAKPAEGETKPEGEENAEG